MLDEVIAKAFQPAEVSSRQITPEYFMVTGDWAFSRGNFESDRMVEGNETPKLG
jgi:hypothetical protein